MKKTDNKNLSAFIVKNDKAVKIIIAVGFALILLILFSELFNFGSDSSRTAQERRSDSAWSGGDADAYARQLEGQLAELLSEIRGVGRVKVMITLGSDGEIRGAAIVAEGGEDVQVKQRVVETVSKVLGIGTSKVSVVY
ncbi:MAG: hypothetical protein FWD48_09155 [Oscillospiraceae bacterium]|nr:hypothetical protein [Oscillospiraceae bacterium]